MALIVRSIEDVFKSYKDYVCKNPERISDIESAVKWISYVLAGKVSDSAILSELVYCISNLWTLANDQIIMHNKLSASDRSGSDSVRQNFNHSIKVWLTVLEYSEVFIELSARHTYGEKGRWILIATIQAFKCILRLLLVSDGAVLPTPPLEPIKRNELVVEDNQGCQNTNNAYSLPSGRTIRTVIAAQNMHTRTWRPPDISSAVVEPASGKNSLVYNGNENSKARNKEQTVGETLFIVKPLVHLGSMYIHGTKSWVPWTFAFLLDILSIKLLESERQKQLSCTHAQILAHRKTNLLRYLFRSPFYDRFTRQRLEHTLLVIAKTIPLAKLIANPLVRYLPHWQETYYYLWSS